MIDLVAHLEGKTHIIFDWNGTILDDMHVCVSVMNGILKEHELGPIEVDFYRRHFTFPVKNYYDLLGFDYTKQAFEVISEKFINGYNARLDECKIFDGSDLFLKSLKDAGYHCSILSAAFERDIHKQLERYGLAHFFTNVAGLDNIHAHGKVARGLELIELLKEPREELILIGDTAHDYEVAEALGIDAIILADGHQDYNRLSNLACKVLPTRY